MEHSGLSGASLVIIALLSLVLLGDAAFIVAMTSDIIRWG
jgi:hypothetical protein